MTGESGISSILNESGETENNENDEDESGVKGKVREVKRHSQMQMERCSRLLQRLKTHQMRVMTEYGETQLESAFNMLTYLKSNQMLGGSPSDISEKGQAGSGQSSSRGKGIVEDTPEYLDRGIYSFTTKNGLEEASDTSEMIHQTLRELRMSSMMLGKDVYDTESDSDVEDEVEMLASKRTPNQEFHGYLNVDDNPATRWARKRNDIVTRWVWLKEVTRCVEERALQFDYLLRHLDLCKPQFKFDPNPVYSGYSKKKAPTVNIENCQVRSFHDNSHRVPEGQKPAEAYDIVGGGLEKLKIRILDSSSDSSCMSHRCMPLMKPYKPRKIYQLGGIHNVIAKRFPEKPTTLCNCYGQTELCAVCTGRNDKVQPLVTGTTSRPELSALMDHTYHKSLSAINQKPLPRLIESCLKTEAWKKKRATMGGEQNDSDSDPELGFTDIELRDAGDPNLKRRPVSPTLLETIKDPRQAAKRARAKSSAKGVKKVATKKKPEPKPKPADSKKSRKRPANRKHDDYEDDEAEDTVRGKATRPSYTMADKARHSRRANEKYDIDHVVIPYSIASATRLEKIEYKEILIPRWREIVISPKLRTGAEMCSATTPKSSKRIRLSVPGGSSQSLAQEEEPVEDISLETIVARHMRSEIEEKQRFLKAMNKTSNRRPRRSECKVENPDTFLTLPSPQDTVEEFSPVKIKSEPIEYPPSNRNQISEADASLAVTALKLPEASGSRRRTISNRLEDDETELHGGVPPFDPRRFPLSNEEYVYMCAETEEEYRLSQLPRASYEDGFLKPKEEPVDEESDADTEEDDPDWRASEKGEILTSHADISRVNKRIGRGSIS